MELRKHLGSDLESRNYEHGADQGNYLRDERMVNLEVIEKPYGFMMTYEHRGLRI